MGLRINTNVQSLQAQSSLSKIRAKQSKNLEKLASGSRINRASDDAAGLAISEKLKAKIRGSQQASRNANDGISMVQTAEGGMNEVSNILIRLRELSIQAASDTINDKERAFTDMEFQSLSTEISRIANSTKFNGRDLINGEGGDAEFQVGIFNNAGLDRISYKPSETSVTLSALGLEGIGVAGKSGAQENLNKIDVAIDIVNGGRAGLGALQNRLQSTINNLDTQVENMSSANSQIRDVDIASETAALTQNNILTAAATTVLSQANSSPNAALKLIG